MSQEDRAQEHEQQEWELRNIGRKYQPAPAAAGDTDYGPAECEECEDPMPALRRANRFRLCTECAAEAERMIALRARR